MTPELIGILSVGAALFVGLGGLILTAWRSVRSEIADLRAEVRSEVADVRTSVGAEISGLRVEVRSEIAGLRAEVRSEIADLRAEMRTEISNLRTAVQGLDRRLSRIEGVIEGLFAGINGRGTRIAESEEGPPQPAG